MKYDIFSSRICDKHNKNYILTFKGWICPKCFEEKHGDLK